MWSTCATPLLTKEPRDTRVLWCRTEPSSAPQYCMDAAFWNTTSPFISTSVAITGTYSRQHRRDDQHRLPSCRGSDSPLQTDFKCLMCMRATMFDVHACDRVCLCMEGPRYDIRSMDPGTLGLEHCSNHITIQASSQMFNLYPPEPLFRKHTCVA